MSAPTLAEKVAQSLEERSEVYSCDALAALVRAADQMDYGLQVEAGSPANGREWRAALSALASALGVTEEA